MASPPPAPRYSAFISYSFADRRWATWLHRALEGYRVPARLRGREGRLGPIGARLPPVFRDRDELAASADLTGAVTAALGEAATLVVICSPRAVASRWVNEEIRAFRAAGRGDAIRCLIVDGEPHAADPARECLPPALFEDGGGEPLAADLRRGQDGPAAARLKLVAGILGLPYDELRQRDAQRRARRLAVLAAASSAGFLLMTALAVVALLSRQEARRQQRAAEMRTATAERTLDFVRSLFEVSDPSEARGADIRARDVLDRGAATLRTSLRDQPEVRAELGVTLGEVYGSLGLYRRSDQQLRWAAGIPVADPAVRARRMAALGDSAKRLGDYRAAAARYRTALAQLGPPGTGSPRADLRRRALAGWAEAALALGDAQGAGRLIGRALAVDSQGEGLPSADVAQDYEVLAQVAFEQDRLAEAELAARRALAIRLRLEGPRSPAVSDGANLLGSVSYRRGDLGAAERWFRSRLLIDRAVLGPDHPDVAISLNNLGRTLLEQRRYREAQPLLERAAAIGEAERGEGHDDMAFAWWNLGIVRGARGDGAGAARDLARALAAARANGQRIAAPVATDLALVRCRAGDVAGGLALAAEAVPALARDYPAEPWRIGWAGLARAACLRRGGRGAEAEAAARGARGVLAARWGAGTHYGYAARHWRGL
jgi:tetratricopeptide (TPR) repeat protein